MYNQFEADKEVYNQDCKFYRFQDKLRWSRFQTIITLEGAWLFVLYSGTVSLTSVEKLSFAVFGFVLVCFLCLLSLKDETDANKHIDRLGEIEDFWDRPYGQARRRPTHYTLGDKWIYPLRSHLPSGSTLMVLTIGCVTLFNGVVLCLVAKEAGLTILTLMLISLFLGAWSVKKIVNRSKGQSNQASEAP